MAHPLVQAHVQPQPHVRLFDELGASRWATARRGALPRASRRELRARAGAATADTTGDALVAEDLSVRLGAGNERVQALRQATLRVKRGTLHMLLGPNGCGKVRAAPCATYSRVQTLKCPLSVDTAACMRRLVAPRWRPPSSRRTARVRLPEPGPPGGDAVRRSRRRFWPGAPRAAAERGGHARRGCTHSSGSAGERLVARAPRTCTC